MLSDKRIHPIEKANLHPRNLHRWRYDFGALISGCAALAPFVKVNEYGDETIDFFQPAAVKMLNRALLMHHYGLGFWDIPSGYLCPPIPGRADYIHHIADVLGGSNGGKIPIGSKISCLDIGVGANCVYPIIGHVSYGWSFVGADIDPISIQSATNIVASNPVLSSQISLRLQPRKEDIFAGIIRGTDRFDLTICNPPFHASLAEAQSGTQRKWRNLKAKKPNKTTLNFGGQSNELWCDGGEIRFIHDLICQSKAFSGACFWFSTLISKQSNLEKAYQTLKICQAVEVITLEMEQGNKMSRIVAWTFLTKEEQQNWREKRWKP